MGQTQELVERRFEILQILSMRRQGATIQELLEQVNCSRATLYRDIEFLERLLPIVRQVTGDSKRICLLGAGQAMTLKVEEVAALRFAREMVQPLKGKWEVDALDSLLRKLGRSTVDPSAKTPQNVRVVKAIDSAIRNGHRIGFLYASATDSEAKERLVDPLALRLHRGGLYLVGYDISKKGIRIFKLSRIPILVVSKGPAELHPEFDEEELFAHSSGIWASEAVEVKILVRQHKARFLEEFPLTSTQSIEEQANGDVVVTAIVSGFQEPLKWLLSWGAAAKGIGPDEFVALAKEEIDGMASEYSLPVST